MCCVPLPAPGVGDAGLRPAWDAPADGTTRGAGRGPFFGTVRQWERAIWDACLSNPANGTALLEHSGLAGVPRSYQLGALWRFGAIRNLRDAADSAQSRGGSRPKGWTPERSYAFTLFFHSLAYLIFADPEDPAIGIATGLAALAAAAEGAEQLGGAGWPWSGEPDLTGPTVTQTLPAADG